MLAKIETIELQIRELEACIQSEEPEECKEILDNLQVSFVAFFSDMPKDVPPELVNNLESFYLKFQNMIEQVSNQKQKIGSDLHKHIGNKRKINAYKNIP
ncbi:hypothetical protein [Pseudoalteromonas xiamenensis]